MTDGASGTASGIGGVANHDARDSACPYPGLEAFSAENRHFFFGRASDTQLLISNLYASPLTVVYGSSGVGKTSVILAGVVPEVEREGEAAILVHRTWQDAARARSLGNRLAQLVGAALGQPPIAADVPLDVLAERLAARWRRPIFLVFDQFEEYFLYNEPSDEPGSLDGELARLINRRDLDVNVMIVLREDSLAALDRFRHRIPTLLNNLYRLEHLTADEARTAIEQPLAVLGARADRSLELPTAMEAGLASNVLDDLASLDRSGGAPLSGKEEARVELPFLQVVLERIWLIECRAHSPLVRRSTFVAAGGARGIVRQRVQEALDRISPEERQVVAAVLRHLVTPSGTKLALTLADLAAYADAPVARVETVVQRLVAGDARVLRRVTHPSSDPALTKYEIYHDALGAPLQAWRLEMDRRRDDGVRRAKRRVRDAMVGLGALVLLTAGVAFFLQQGKHRVEARELATIASGQLETDNGRALLLAMASIDRSGSEQAGEIVLRRALFEPGERQRTYAPAGIQWLTVSPDGRYVMGTRRNGESALWRVDSLADVPLPVDIRSARAASFDSLSRHVLVVDGSNPVLLTLDSVVSASRVPSLAGSVVTGTLLRAGDRALLVYSGSGVVEWQLRGASWQQVARTTTSGPSPRELTVSADERWVAWVSSGVLTIADRQQQPWFLRTIPLPGGRATQVQFVSRREVAVATGSDTMRVFDVETLQEETPIPLSCNVTRFTFASGEAAGMCGDRGVVLFNLPRTRSQARMGLEPPLMSSSTPLSDVVLSPDGRLMLWLPKGDQVTTVWSVYSRSEVTRLRGHRGSVIAATFLPDSRRVVTAGADSTLRTWEVVSATQRIGDGEFMAGQAHVEIDDAVDRVAMIGPYGVQLWDVTQGRVLLEEPVAHSTPVLAISRGGERLATLGDQSELLELTEGRAAARTVELPRSNANVVNRAGIPLPIFGSSSLLRYATGPTKAPTLLLTSERSPSGRSDSSSIVRISPLDRRVDELALFSRAITALAVDSAGSRAAIALDDGRVQVLGLGDGERPRDVAKHADRASVVALARSGIVASGGSGGDVQVVMPDARSPAAEPGVPYAPAITLGTHERGVVRVTFNRAASVLASGDEGGTVRLWSMSPPRELCSLEGQHADYIRDIAFAPSGKTIATADERGVALWFVDEPAGDCRFGYRLVDLESPTEALRFAPDGSALVVVGRDGVIRRYGKAVWAPRDSLLALAERRLRGRRLTPAEVERYTKSR
ncbi:MAG: WD40 repeat domain-containing protein [Gemmatimonadota bacterium]